MLGQGASRELRELEQMSCVEAPGHATKLTSHILVVHQDLRSWATFELRAPAREGKEPTSNSPVIRTGRTSFRTKSCGPYGPNCCRETKLNEHV